MVLIYKGPYLLYSTVIVYYHHTMHVSRHEGVCHTHHLFCASESIELILFSHPVPHEQKEFSEGMLVQVTCISSLRRNTVEPVNQDT